jgi:hypothetical protein
MDSDKNLDTSADKDQHETNRVGIHPEPHVAAGAARLDV